MSNTVDRPAATTTFRFYSHNMKHPALANALRVHCGIDANKIDEPISPAFLDSKLAELLHPKTDEVKIDA